MALRLRFSHALRSFVASAELTVPNGETLALVGPSGAGKTTILRVVAGLLRPQSGSITLGETVLLDTERGIDIAPEHRRVGYLFQEYALFPHLDVAANVRFGARDRGRVDELLERFRIDHLARAHVGELSGGERQRVALARALARDPEVLLLDEPLSALDTHTRAGVRAELHELLHGLALPTLLVTHDFEDAATLADRVGVIDQGRILQTDSPTELVAVPADSFVATFTGAVLLSGHAIGNRNGLTEVVVDGGFTAWSADMAAGPVTIAVYPWDVSLGPVEQGDSRLNHLTAPITSIAPLGNRVRVHVGPLVAEITAASAERLALHPGVSVTASFKATSTRLFPLRSAIEEHDRGRVDDRGDRSSRTNA
jgi:molybdate transport system ATP-binding protein